MVTLQEVDYFDIGINSEKIREEKLTFICAREETLLPKIYCMRTQVRYSRILRNQETRIVTEYKNETFSHVTRKKKINDRDYPNIALATTRKDQVFVYFGELET